MLPAALDSAISSGDENMQIDLLGVKANILIHQHDYEAAISNTKQVLSYYQQKHSQDMIAYLYAELSNYYRLNDNKDSAFFYGQKALHFSKKHGLKKELNDAHYALYKY